MSVRKRLWKTSKGEPRETWIVDYVDQSGKRHIETFSRKADAEARHDRLKTDIRDGKHVPIGKNESVADLCDVWIKNAEAQGRERSTLKQYREHVRLHIVPRIGRLKLAKVTTGHLQKFRDDLLASMSRALARKVLASLHSALKGAKRAHLIEGITIATDKRSKRPVEAGHDFPTPTEIKQMIAAAPDIKRRALLLTLALTGVRSSELRGLRWSDLDLKAATLHVRQRRDRFGDIGNPKSAAGTRTVPLERGLLVPALREWKMACPPGDLVFPWTHHQILRALGPAVEKYGLHGFRHFFASWCLGSPERGGRGRSIPETQRWLGHASPVMTLTVYSHCLPAVDDHRELDEAAKALLS